MKGILPDCTDNKNKRHSIWSAFCCIKLFRGAVPAYEDHYNYIQSRKHPREAENLEPHEGTDSDYGHETEKGRAGAQNAHSLFRTESRVQKPVVKMLSVRVEGAFPVGDPAEKRKARIHKRIDQRNKRHENGEDRVEFEKAEHRSSRQDISKKL